MVSDVVEVRCPVGPRRLFTKLRLGEESGRYIHPQNWLEFTCSDCAGRLGKQRGESVRVFHRFTFIGDLAETIVETRTG